MNWHATKLVDLQVAVSIEGITMPYYPTEFAGGMIVHAAERCVVRQTISRHIPAGFALALPPGLGALITAYTPPRGFSIVATSRMLSADDRDPIEVLVHHPMMTNCSDTYLVQRGDPIAEISFVPLLRARLWPVTELLCAPGLRKPPTFTDQQ